MLFKSVLMSSTVQNDLFLIGHLSATTQTIDENIVADV